MRRKQMVAMSCGPRSVGERCGEGGIRDDVRFNPIIDSGRYSVMPPDFKPVTRWS